MPEIKKLESLEALDDAFDRSEERPVVMFKHSLICPTSSRAFGVFRDFVEEAAPDGADYRLIEIQRQRSLSREVEARTGVKHESPQALVLRRGEVTWHESHLDITRKALESALG